MNDQAGLKAFYIETQQDNPYENLALEEYLLDRVGPDEMILFLWQNRHTIVIGRNQNAWRECRTAQIEQDGAYLARRCTGGGAVYHDLGNVNFSFIAGRQHYDFERQLSVVLGAVRALGIPAEFTGRNDCTVFGRKFSGHAYCLRREAGLHHGTLLVDTDMQQLSRYLQVSPQKMRAKGVASVQARVINLIECKPDLTVEMTKQALSQAFEKEYGKAERYSFDPDDPLYHSLRSQHQDWQWRYGLTPRFDVQLDTRLGFGSLELSLEVKQGIIVRAYAYSDAMDGQFITQLPCLLEGERCQPEAIAARVAADAHPYAREIARYLAGLEL